MRLAPTAAAICLVLLAGCAGSGYRYVSDRELGAYLKFPATWRLFDEEEVLADDQPDADPDELALLRTVTWTIVFDGSSDPSLDHVGTPATDAPWGLVRVRQLGSAERDAYSLADLRAELTQTDPLTAAGAFEILDQEDLVRDGVRGSRLVFDQVREDGLAVRVDQTALVDDTTEHVYVLMVGCAPDCFDAHRDVLDEIVTSWTVEAS